ncbi:hypothetical protein ACJ41O_004010 [Fusarium nematophilum]
MNRSGPSTVGVEADPGIDVKFRLDIDVKGDPGINVKAEHDIDTKVDPSIGFLVEPLRVVKAPGVDINAEPASVVKAEPGIDIKVGLGLEVKDESGIVKCKESGIAVVDNVIESDDDPADEWDGEIDFLCVITLRVRGKRVARQGQDATNAISISDDDEPAARRVQDATDAIIVSDDDEPLHDNGAQSVQAAKN